MDEKEIDTKVKKHCTETVGLKEGTQEYAECVDYWKKLLKSSGIDHADWEQRLLKSRGGKKAGAKKGDKKRRTKKRTRKGGRRRKTRKY